MKQYKKIIQIICIICLFNIISIENVKGYYSIPKNTTATYQITAMNSFSDGKDYFMYLEEGDQLYLRIIESNVGFIQTELSSDRVFYQLEEDIQYGWTNSSCFPFVINTFYFNTSLEQNIFNIVSTQYENIGENTRNTIIIRQNKTIYEDISIIELTYYYKYDITTGLLINWYILNSFSLIQYINIDLIETNAWSPSVSPSLWWVWIIVIGCFIGSGILLYYIISNKKKLK